MKEKKGAGEKRTVPEKVVLDQIDLMIAERTARSQSAKSAIATQASAGAIPIRTITRDAPTAPMTTSAKSFAVTSQVATSTEEQSIQQSNEDAGDNGPREAITPVRDAGVSDQVWDQLQKDAQKAEEEKRECRRLAEKEEELRQWLKKCADAKRQRELEEIERQKQELEEKLRRQEKELAKVAQMGLCPAGFHWIKQSGGYRCAGGSHWVSNAELQKLCG